METPFFRLVQIEMKDPKIIFNARPWVIITVAVMIPTMSAIATSTSFESKGQPTTEVPTTKSEAGEVTPSEPDRDKLPAAKAKNPFFERIQLSATQGDADAQCLLGKLYAEGDGIEKNLKLAAQFYRLAADQGQDLAQQRLGDCYQNGLGVPKNDTEAYVWFSLSAENGQTLNGRGRAGELLDEITKDLSPKKLVRAKTKVSHLQKKIALKEKANYTKIINQLGKNGWKISMNIDKNGGHCVKAKKEGETSQSQAPNWRVAFNSVKRQCEDWPEKG